MSARTTITTDDGETTPVTHTFQPFGDVTTNANVLQYRNFNAAAPIASELLTLFVRSSGSTPNDIMTYGKKVDPRVFEMRLKVPLTFVDTSTGLTNADYVNEAILRFNLHPRSTEQTAKNMRKMIYNLLNYANGNQIVYGIDRGEPVW